MSVFSLEKMTPHLAFSLLGVTGLDEFESVDRSSELVAKLLYAIFLIMGVILLINMMIALLSNTYQHVQVLAEKLKEANEKLIMINVSFVQLPVRGHSCHPGYYMCIFKT